MNIIGQRWSAVISGALWAVICGFPAFADDTELFLSNSSQFGADTRPNVLLVLDTSSSMLSEVTTQGTYDPAVIYSGDCAGNRVYWRTGTGDAPDCSTDQWIERSSLVCKNALDSFAQGPGYFSDRMAQYNAGRADQWQRLVLDENTRAVECEQDRGLHGDGSSGIAVYAQNGNDSQLWSTSPADEVSWGQSPVDRDYTLYDGNYLNWFFGPSITSTRMQVMKDVLINSLNSTSNINIGLMRFNRREGGPVLHAMENITTAETTIVNAINDLMAEDFTPLSETLYEAGQYYAGGDVDFGNVVAANSRLSVPESRQFGNSDFYDSPIEYGCQKNFIVLLTDGTPNEDTSADEKIPTLPNFTSIVGSGCDGEGEGNCLDDMSAYLFNADLDPDLPGQQNVVTHTIGFAIDLPLLASTAARGGGSYFTADDTASLANALSNVVTSVLSTQTAFTAPAVSINSFNRTQTLNDLYLTLFETSRNTHWPGNLKKYRLSASAGAILDANGNAAIDPASGMFNVDSRSFWSATADGAEVQLGGAANQLPEPATRNLYTYLGNALLTDSRNLIRDSNPAINSVLLGIGGPGDPSRADLIDFIRGVDVTDSNQNGDSTEPRNEMGDPLHASPTPVIYGGTLANPNVNDAVVYFSTNDGFLHAIDAMSGVELWAFVPPEFLSDQVFLYRDEPTANKHYGVDGNMRVQILADNNGIIEPGRGEKVYLYFGMRRGGALYYALDVTVPESPQLLWRSDAIDLPGLGQSWSTPIPTRINIEGATQNPEKMVLAIAGGYDPSQDADSSSTDNTGNSIYFVDSVSGDLLWHASDDGADRNLAGMQYSFPSDLKVIDLDGDDFADRIYASDMGGQIWRFDIFNGQPATTLVNGGVIAQLGGAPAADPAIIDNRRFYYSPDVALVTDDNNSFLHLGIGSGHRAHPNSTANRDRFYALRDYNAFGGRTQADYDSATAVDDADLVDITNDVSTVVPIGSPGWRLELRDGGWQGEKVLAEARTFDNQIFFTTFTPGPAANANNCDPSLGTNRLYVLDIHNGAPVNNLDGIGDEQELTLTDRSQVIQQGSIASEAVLLFPTPDDPSDPSCVGNQCSPEPLVCVDLFCFSPGFGNAPVRTFWSQESVR